MRVLFWMFNGFDSRTTSEHLLLAVIERLCLAGHSVHIIQKDTGGGRPHVPECLSGYPVTTDTVPFLTADKNNFAARYVGDLKYVRACKKLIGPGFDAVFVQSNNVAGFAMRAVRKKLPKAVLTFNVQDIFPYNAAYSGVVSKNSPVFGILAAVQRYGYRCSDHVITISEDMKDTLISDGVDGDKINVIYNWSYGDETYDAPDVSPVMHLFGKNFRVVYAGNIGVMQNADLLIETARLMKDDISVGFYIIGDGVYKKRLEAKTTEYGLTNVTFLPMQPPELAPLVYSAADVNVIPLIRDGFRTALPSKTATCLACGKPVVFALGKNSKFGRMAEEEAGCTVVESDSPGELAEAIRAIKSGGKRGSSAEFFTKHLGKTANSEKYAEIITAKG
ncbi:MAG: glycosyltransferase family 4 protein [Clostridia bacterium]|nr:glycosyltransferase family 4 protein [Clostridia bacterium]